LDPAAAADQALRMEAEGADIIDVGGESTRPGAEPVGTEEELRRTLPALEKLAGRLKVPVSIDTRNPAVARAAIEAGACMVNDVGAARAEEEMGGVVARSGAAYVITHARGEPKTMQAAPVYDDVAAEVEKFFRGQMERMRSFGVGEEQLVLDVGIGFGKTLEHNLRLLRATNRFAALRRPVMLGVSRKSFMKTLLGLEVMRRWPAALACAAYGAQAGASLIRTHDVWETKACLGMVEAILAAEGSAALQK
jgi:dihydropteroate synthase